MKYTIACCVSQGQHKYTPENFIEFEKKVLDELKFQLYTTTPYEYLEATASSLTLNENDVCVIEATIDFCLSLVDLAECTAEEVFGISFLAFFLDRSVGNLRLFFCIDRLVRKFNGIQEKAKLIR